jgi:hypothetical protein
VKALSTALVLGLLAAACGGSGSPPPSSTPPPATSTDPCSTAILEEDAGYIPTAQDLRAQARKREAVDGSARWRVLDHLWTHAEAQSLPEQAALQRRARAAPRSNADIGEIAIVQDEGDLILPPNTYDLKSIGLRFVRNAAGGYTVTRIDSLFRAALGTRVTLTDDDSSQQNVPFSFSFYGKTQTTAFVNSDGNITFEDADKSSTERNVARLLTGPPRVSPFLADLDPTTGSGRVFVNAASDHYTVTWCNVRGFDSERTATVQATLLPSGNIEMIFGAINLGDAIVGLSPGRTTTFATLNLSDAGTLDGGSSALGERFAEQPQLDLVALTQKFYRTHPDNYDQLVLWADTRVVTDAFAYETTVKNEVRGIGLDTFDLAGNFGSAGRLRSLVVMDRLGKYPDNPLSRFLGENNTVSLLGQESGHRWLAFLEFRDRTGTRSDALLGRDLAHWSFFLDSDASVMEGNDIEDLGGGSFRTTAAVRRYSALDQYAMGLLAESQVPTFFYVENPVNVSGSRDRESAPEVGVTFNGTRRDVLIEDIVRIHGARSPSAGESARVHRQAFIYLVSNGRTADAAAVTKIDNIRKAWDTFFLQATDGRMRAITTLQ